VAEKMSSDIVIIRQRHYRTTDRQTNKQTIKIVLGSDRRSDCKVLKD